jgi:predicted ATPase
VFTRIEAKNYRCLKDVSQSLNPFEILVGPNGSGKSTFLDVIDFLGDFVSEGLSVAVERRTDNLIDLFFGREGRAFSLSIDSKPPSQYPSPVDHVLRYEVEFRWNPQLDEFVANYQYLRYASMAASSERMPPVLGSNEPRRNSVLADGSPNEPGAFWLKGLLREGLRKVQLEAEALRRPSLPGSGEGRLINGSALARMVLLLRTGYPERFQDWLAHVRTALPEIRDIDSKPREWERSRQVMVEYQDGVQLPSWVVSEGTLRLLQLTILAYLPADFHGVYLVEEPENGVHPSALETIYQSLSSINGAQVLVSSHSPILLNMAKPKQLLCFSKAPDGVKIVRGDKHPALLDWQNEVSLGTLAASGILG